jgi:hypothetical protein
LKLKDIFCKTAISVQIFGPQVEQAKQGISSNQYQQLLCLIKKGACHNYLASIK